jgi:murein DD-endopeptidase MepM/ murein hydrolase activator NlpD
LKPEITQKDKSVSSLKTHQKVSAQSVTIPGQPSGLAKLASLSVNHRSRNSALMAGLALSLGITGFPVNHRHTVATATEQTTRNLSNNSQAQKNIPAISADESVRQLRSDVSMMRLQHGQKSSVLLAQVEPGRAYPSVANRGEARFGQETSVQIFVPAPRTQYFKPVAAASPAYEPDDQLDNFPSRNIYPRIAFTWPAAGKLSSGFGRRWGRMHRGIDIAGPVGTPIHAAAEGSVVFAGWSSGGFGNLVEIRHSDGTITRYAHNSRLLVSLGQTVTQGQQIAAMGSTGRSTGSHLHFEIRPGGASAIDPIAYLSR